MTRDTCQCRAARGPHIVADDARDEIEVHRLRVVPHERVARVCADGNDPAGCGGFDAARKDADETQATISFAVETGTYSGEDSTWDAALIAASISAFISAR